MLVVIIDVCLVTNMADYIDVNFRQNFSDSNLNKSSSFCNIFCSISATIFILTMNHADIIGDQSDAVTENAWFRCALCAAISGEISILIQTGGRVLSKVSCTKNLPLGQDLAYGKLHKASELAPVQWVGLELPPLRGRQLALG